MSFISHDFGRRATSADLADRIGVIVLGELVDIGPADAVFNPPHHPDNKALVAAMPRLEPDSALQTSA